MIIEYNESDLVGGIFIGFTLRSIADFWISVPLSMPVSFEPCYAVGGEMPRKRAKERSAITTKEELARLTASPEFRAWKRWKDVKACLQVVGKVLVLAALVGMLIIVRISSQKHVNRNEREVESEKGKRWKERMKEVGKLMAAEDLTPEVAVREEPLYHTLGTDPEFRDRDVHAPQSNKTSPERKSVETNSQEEHVSIASKHDLNSQVDLEHRLLLVMLSILLWSIGILGCTYQTWRWLNQGHVVSTESKLAAFATGALQERSTGSQDLRTSGNQAGNMILPVSRKEVIHWPTMEVKCPTVEGDEKYMEQALHGNDLFGDQVYSLRSESTQFEEVENVIQRNLKVSSHETIMTDIEGNISQDACGDAKAGNNIANDQDLLEPDSECARTRKDLRAQSEEGSQGIVNLSPSDSESNQSLWNPAMQPKSATDEVKVSDTPQILPPRNICLSGVNGEPKFFEDETCPEPGFNTSALRGKRRSYGSKQRNRGKIRHDLQATGKKENGRNGPRKEPTAIIVMKRKAVLEATPRVLLEGKQNVAVCSRWLNGHCDHGHLCFYRHSTDGE